ncbi:SNARE Sed5 [Schizosaccharomyces cryophilus OY26]|uniref:SNARE Sed5 n=1 Tax=Schizosaccharomyces cryophilus (strain OY26 / ATCC MYA-4695 / CBS 11777 / NBRC 106824 / NRRL Y48691) TaxID=653667 RepID=S9VT08_SCHCR|nr:SNARE Sed5 [Schizosaccharomyces cryophilus OY26]EPY49265.1 SNARE Sed5 [Schizosaccharomyces cryophilus OY26]
MSFQDRTAEFQACVANTRARMRISSSNAAMSNALQAKHQKSEFTTVAKKIAFKISETSKHLQRLSQLAKRKTLFDDRPVEIQELTYQIKQSLSSLNSDIASLQQIVRQSSKGTRNKPAQINQHNENIVVSLQNSLADTSMNFKDILEVRTQNMKASQNRTEKFVASTSLNTNPLANNNSATSPFNYNESKYEPNDDYLALNLGEGANTRYEQMALLENQTDVYSQQRMSSIESIESTISELGGIFSQLAQMVSEQRETVQRIDLYTDDIASNINSAQREILKFFDRVSSNRALLFKIFGILIAFFLLWVLVT